MCVDTVQYVFASAIVRCITSKVKQMQKQKQVNKRNAQATRSTTQATHTNVNSAAYNTAAAIVAARNVNAHAVVTARLNAAAVAATQATAVAAQATAATVTASVATKPLSKKQRVINMLISGTTIAAIASELNISATAARSLIGDVRAAKHTVAYANNTYKLTA